MIGALKKILPAWQPAVHEKNAVDAYNLWCERYDDQPGNLMLDLDNDVFGKLLQGLEMNNKQVADIGCGTGRHWPKMYRQSPAGLTGFDVSAGMLGCLKAKFPDADIQVISDDSFPQIPDNSYDVIVSTLTVAHIENIEQALQAWSRMLKYQGDIIITDFHPDALAYGGKRTFEYQKKKIAIQNFVHYVRDLKELLMQEGFRLVAMEERYVDENVKHYYQAKNALQVYERFNGSKMIYGMHLKRG